MPVHFLKIEGAQDRLLWRSSFFAPCELSFPRSPLPILLTSWVRSTCSKSVPHFPSQKMVPYHIFAVIFLRCYTKHLYTKKFLCWSLAGKVCAVTISLLNRASAWMKVIYSIILHVNYTSTLGKISLTADVKDNRESSQCSSQNEFAVSHLEA